MAQDITPVIVFIKNALQGTANYAALQNSYNVLKQQYDADEQQLAALLQMIASAPAIAPIPGVPVGTMTAPANTGTPSDGTTTVMGDGGTAAVITPSSLQIPTATAPQGSTAIPESKQDTALGNTHSTTDDK